MKKICTFLSLMAIMTSGFAQWKNDNNRRQNDNGQYNNGQYNNGRYNNNYKSSALVVNAFSKNRIMVVVDNNYQYQANGSVLEVGGLQAGMHNIVVYEWRSNFWGKQKREVLYSSALFLKPNVETAISINSFGRVKITENALYQNNQYGNNRNGKHHDDDDRERREDDHKNGNGRY